MPRAHGSFKRRNDGKVLREPKVFIYVGIEFEEVDGRCLYWEVLSRYEEVSADCSC